jgi:hypothetical protein
MLTFRPGQLHVQQDQIGHRGPREFALTAEKADRFLAIANQAHSTLHAAQLEGLYRTGGIRQVVLDQEDLHIAHCVSMHGSSPPFNSPGASVPWTVGSLLK